MKIYGLIYSHVLQLGVTVMAGTSLSSHNCIWVGRRGNWPSLLGVRPISSLFWEAEKKRDTNR